MLCHDCRRLRIDVQVEEETFICIFKLLAVISDSSRRFTSRDVHSKTPPRYHIVAIQKSQASLTLKPTLLKHEGLLPHRLTQTLSMSTTCIFALVLGVKVIYLDTKTVAR